MWDKIASIILRNRIVLIITLGLITIFMAYQSSFVELSYVYHKILPASDEEYQDYIKFKEKFGEDGSVMVLGIKSDKLFELEQYNDWQKLSKEIKNIDGVKGLVSISHLYNIYKDSPNKRFEIKLFPSQQVASQAEMDSIKDIVLRLPFYKEIVFNDSNATLIAITFETQKLNSKQRITIVDEIVSKAEEFGIKHNIDVHYSGLPYIRTKLAALIAHEIKLFLILALIITSIILLIFFRSVYAVILPLLLVAICVTWSFGSIALFDFKITMLTGLIPPLVVVIGIPNAIFLLNKYHDEFRRHGNKAMALNRMIKRIGVVILITNTTTAVGFGTFALSGPMVLKEFGIISFLNILAIYVISMVFIPIVFSFLPAPSQKQTVHLESKRLQKSISMICNYTNNYRRLIYITTVIVIAFSVYGLTMLKTLGYMVDDIPEHHPLFVDLKFFEKNFKGVMPFEIIIDSKKKGGIPKLSTLQKIEKLEKIIQEYPEFAKPISIVGFINFSKQSFFNGNEKQYCLPNQQELSFIFPYLNNAKEKEHKIYNIIDSTKQLARISVQMADVGSIRIREIKDDLKPRVDSIFSPDKFNVKLTGTSLVFLKGNQYLISNLRQSLVIAMMAIALLMYSLFVSFRMLGISLITNIIPLLITGGLMGFFGIYLKPSTILIFSIAFGLSVDTSIHFLAKYRLELRNTNWNVFESVSRAINDAGVSMIYTSVVLFFGFGIFMASTFGGTASLGFLIAITLLLGMLSNLVLLPSLLLTMDRRMSIKALKKEALVIVYDEEEDIELDKLNIETIINK